MLAACERKPECPDIMQPPEVMDHAPSGAVITRELGMADVDGLCRSMGAEPHRVGCSRGNLVIIPSLDSGRSYQGCVLRHEWGHVNGWPTDHAGGRML